MIRLAVLTCSDRASRGEYEDLSGPAIVEMFDPSQVEIVAADIVPDEADIIEQKFLEYADDLQVDLAISTGGTGFSTRDVTPEATLRVIERQVPGISEYMRIEGAKITDKAILSRGVSGIRGNTLIINLPGKPQAVQESLGLIMDVLLHAVRMLAGEGH